MTSATDRFQVLRSRPDVGLAVLLGAALAVLVIGQGPRWLALAQGSRDLRAALLLRQEIGDLPLGPDTPGIYALGRAAGDAANAPRRSEVRQGLRTAADTLAQVRGGERLAGIALGSLGDHEAATAALQAAPVGDFLAQLALGNGLDEAGQGQAAAQRWQSINAPRALSLQLYRMGVRLAAQERRAQAEAMLTRAVAIDPSNASAYHALGGFYWAQDRARALEMYQAALAAGPLEPFFAHLARGRIAFAGGRLEEAAAELEAAVALQPDHDDAVTLLGTVLGRLGRLDEAIGYLERAAARSPRAFWPLLELGRIYLDLGDYEQAITTLSTAAQRRTDVAQSFELLAESYARAGHIAQAIPVWRQALALNPNNSLSHARLGDALRESGQTEAAIAAYRQALQLNPNNDAARDQLLILGVTP